MTKNRAIDRLKGHAGTAVIVGSGFSGFTRNLPSVSRMEYAEFEGLPAPTVEGHPGRVILYRPPKGDGACIFMGRSHLYEGISIREASSAVRIAARAGCRRLLLVNAAGGLRPDIEVGSWILPSDIMVFPSARFGETTTSLKGLAPGSALLCESLRRKIGEAALNTGVRLLSGIAVFNRGPCYETVSEARAARIMGGDLVTMSLLPELLEAERLGLKSAVLSLITNHTPNVDPSKKSHSKVLKMGAKGGEGLKSLLDCLLRFNQPGRREGRRKGG